MLHVEVDLRATGHNVLDQVLAQQGQGVKRKSTRAKRVGIKGMIVTSESLSLLKQEAELAEERETITKKAKKLVKKMKEDELVHVVAESMHHEQISKEKYKQKEEECDALRQEHAALSFLNDDLLGLLQYAATRIEELKLATQSMDTE